MISSVIEELPECRALLHVTISPEESKTTRENLFAAYQNQVRLPGFRPGKAPKALIEKKFGADIESELSERPVSQGLRESIREKNVVVLEVKNIKDNQFEEDGTYKFSAELVLEPKFELPEYQGLEVTIPKLEYTDENFQEQLDRILRNFATYDEVTDRAIQASDLAILDYTVTVDGQSTAEVAPEAPAFLKDNTQTWVEIDPEHSHYPAGFIEPLIGLNKDDETQISVHLPEDHPTEALRDKELVYQVKVREIKARNLPELNDELATRLMGADKTAEDLKTQIRNAGENEIRQQRDAYLTNAVLVKLEEQLTFDIPQELIESETARRVDEIAKEAVQRGLNDEYVLEHQEEILSNAGEQARTNVKIRFILQEIARKENFQVSNDEMSRAIFYLSREQRKNPKTYVKELQRDGLLPRIQLDILMEKALRLIKESAKVTETNEELGSEEKETATETSSES